MSIVCWLNDEYKKRKYRKLYENTLNLIQVINETTLKVKGIKKYITKDNMEEYYEDLDRAQLKMRYNKDRLRKYRKFDDKHIEERNRLERYASNINILLDYINTFRRRRYPIPIDFILDYG